MNILYLTNHLNIGGISSYILTLAKGMKEKGHLVYVASGGGELAGRFKGEGINYIPVPIKTKSEISPKILFSFLRLMPQLREKNIDIIHANTRVTQVLACLLGARAHKPFISTCHGFFKRRLSRRIFPCWGKKVIAISEQVKGHLVQDFKVKESIVRVIHNGIDLERFRLQAPVSSLQAKANFGLSDGPVIGIVARLSDVKGHRFLLEALPLVLRQVPHAQLLIVGEGREKEKLATLARSLGIEKHVFFLASVNDTREVLSIIDLFVMPSLKEGLGLSLMEAMAGGKAVIGSSVGGIKTLIQHNSNGLLVEPADASALAGAILELLKDGQKRESLGRRARDFIQRNFSQGKMAQETEEVYLECLDAVKY